MAKTVLLAQLDPILRKRCESYLTARDLYLEAREIFEVTKDVMRNSFPEFYRIRTGEMVIHVRPNYVSATKGRKPKKGGGK